MRHNGMSALGQKRTSASIDHFIRTQQECFCNLQSERLGGCRIDDKVELGWLLDRQVCRLRTSQYFVDILGRAPKQIWEVRSVRHQSPCFDVLAEPKHCRQPRAKHQSSNAPPICGEQRIGAKIEGLCSSFKRLYRGLQIIHAPNFRLDNIKTVFAGCRLSFTHLQNGVGTTGIGHYSKCAQTGQSLPQNFETLTSKIGLLDRQPGDVAARSCQRCYQSGADWIAGRSKHDWNGCGYLLGSGRCWSSVGDDDIDPKSNKLGCDLPKSSLAPLGPSVLYRNSLAFNPAQFTQTLYERCGPIPRGGCRRSAEETYGRQFSELCVTRERPCDGRAAEKGEELAPLHVPSARDHALRLSLALCDREARNETPHDWIRR